MDYWQRDREVGKREGRIKAGRQMDGQTDTQTTGGETGTE